MAGGDKGGSRRPQVRGSDLEERIDDVEALLCSGQVRGGIVQAARKHWGISSRQASEYIAKVHRRWEQERDQDRPKARALQVRRLLTLYRRAMQDEDYRAALGVEALLHAIQGTKWQPSDDLQGAGAAEIVILRAPPKTEEGD